MAHQSQSSPHEKEMCWFVFWRNPLNWSKPTAQSPVLFSPRSFKQVSLSQNRNLLYLFADGVQMWHCVTGACQSSWNWFKGESSQQLLLFTFLLLCSSLVDATFNFAPTMNFPFPMRAGTSSLTMSDPLLDSCCFILREITASQCLSVLSPSAYILERKNIY